MLWLCGCTTKYDVTVKTVRRTVFCLSSVPNAGPTRPWRSSLYLISCHLTRLERVNIYIGLNGWINSDHYDNTVINTSEHSWFFCDLWRYTYSYMCCNRTSDWLIVCAVRLFTACTADRRGTAGARMLVLGRHEVIKAEWRQ